MEIHQIPQLREPVMILAFSGWNDAAEAATGAVSHILGSWTDPSLSVVPELVAEVDSEEFYDFQVNRPMISLDDSSNRLLTWPGTQIFALALPHLPMDLIIVRGVEPSMKWISFTKDILDLADDLEVSSIITVGSMLADAPHTRPIVVASSGSTPEVSKRLSVELSRYEGPTGILGAVIEACVRRGVDAVSFWAAVPHYASSSPSPKATLALVNAIENFLDIDIPQGSLPESAQSWQLEVDDLAQEDSEVAEYVKALEESKDSTKLPDVTGDEIAKELERFLRRQSGG